MRFRQWLPPLSASGWMNLCYSLRGFFKALCDVRRVQGGQLWATLVPLIRLRELTPDHARFHYSIWNYKRGSEGDFFDHLLDWAMLRCNYRVPLERLQIQGSKCVTKDVSRIREVIVEVEWD